MLLHKNNTSVKLLSADGSKNHGNGSIRELTPMIGPSFIKKMLGGVKINLLTGIDTTGM